MRSVDARGVREARLQVLLARLARGEIGFQHRNLAVAARLGGTQIGHVGIQAPSPMFAFIQLSADLREYRPARDEFALQRLETIGTRE